MKGEFKRTLLKVEATNCLSYQPYVLCNAWLVFKNLLFGRKIQNSISLDQLSRLSRREINFNRILDVVDKKKILSLLMSLVISASRLPIFRRNKALMNSIINKLIYSEAVDEIKSYAIAFCGVTTA